MKKVSEMDRESIISSVRKIMPDVALEVINIAYDLVLRDYPLYARPPRARNDHYFFQEVLRYIRVYHSVLEVWC